MDEETWAGLGRVIPIDTLPGEAYDPVVYTSIRHGPGSAAADIDVGGPSATMPGTTLDVLRSMNSSRALARRADAPRYQQIREILATQIRSGTFKSGDQLPSEDELGREFRVTRMTVRQAVSGLVSEGMVYRRHGKGTFVGDPKVTRRFARLTGFSEDVIARGQHPGARTLALRKVPASVEVAEALGVAVGAPVVLVHRLRMLDARPAALQRSYLAADLVPGLERLDGEFPSLYQLLRTRFGLSLHHADQIIEARQATATETRLLRARPHAPVVQVLRKTFLDNGRPVELARMVYRADLFKFQMQLWVEGE